MSLRTLTLGVAIIGLASAALAASHGGNPAVKARQAHMTLYGSNLGILGAMAKGETEYDADAASAAANNLVALTSIDQRAYWVPGTTADDIEGTRLKGDAFDNVDKAMAAGKDLAAAVENLASVAGDGQEALGPALGPVGKACGSCHEVFRLPNN